MPPEVVQRAEVLSGLSQSLIDVLPGRTVAGEDHSEVLGVRCFFDHSALCVVDVVSGRMRFEQETLVPIECEVAVSSCALGVVGLSLLCARPGPCGPHKQGHRSGVVG